MTKKPNTYSYLEGKHMAQLISENINIDYTSIELFCRVSPDQKEKIVIELKKIDKVF